MPESLVEARGLRSYFPLRTGLLSRIRGEQPSFVRAVDGVDLAVHRKEILGLVGESGCGKSTLAYSIAGLRSPTSGEVLFGGRPLRLNSSRKERRRIQIVFQDPYSSLNPRMTVRQVLREILIVHSLVRREEVAARCADLLQLVGLDDGFLDSYPHQLSGGQRQRVSIARAVALEPELLVADEPVSALDVSVQATILSLLTSLQHRLGLTILLITHDMGVVRQVCDRTAVMYLGRIVELASTEALFGAPHHPYTDGLLKAVPSLVPGRESGAPAISGEPPSAINVPLGCRFHPRCRFAQPKCREDDPILAAGAECPEHWFACHFPLSGLSCVGSSDKAARSAR